MWSRLQIWSKDSNPSTQVLQVITFIIGFGLFVSIISVLINHFLDPHIHSLTHLVAIHPLRALLIYFIFVLGASVIVPIPTLPVDLLFFGLIDPASVIVVRIAGALAGGSVCYFLAYNFGRPLLRRWLSDGNYQFIEKHSNKLTWQEFFIITMIPVINVELMAYVGGLGKIGYRKTISTILIATGYRVLFIYLVLHYHYLG